jgi:starvation-inducible DNA-binding protein
MTQPATKVTAISADAARTKAKYTTQIDIPADKRTQSIAILNQQLADTFDLLSQTKQAHWNVKGMNFIALHELFDKFAAEVTVYVDDLAERVTSLGGSAHGTVRIAARNSRLTEFPLEGIDCETAVQELSKRYAELAASTRKAIDITADLGDADTADLLTGISRGLDKSLWFIEAHLQA